KLVVIVAGVSLGMQLLMGLIAGSPNDQPSIFTSIVMSVLSVVAALVSLSLDAGVDRILLNLVDGKITSLNQLLVSGKTVFNILIATLLFSLLLFVGFLLFFIPGIYFALKYSQFQYAIIDKNMGPIEALKESARLTKGKKLTLIG